MIFGTYFSDTSASYHHLMSMCVNLHFALTNFDIFWRYSFDFNIMSSRAY